MTQVQKKEQQNESAMSFDPNGSSVHIKNNESNVNMESACFSLSELL